MAEDQIAHRGKLILGKMAEKLTIAKGNPSIFYDQILWSCYTNLRYEAWKEVAGIVGESGMLCICVVDYFSILHDN